MYKLYAYIYIIYIYIYMYVYTHVITKQWLNNVMISWFPSHIIFHSGSYLQLYSNTLYPYIYIFIYTYIHIFPLHFTCCIRIISHDIYIYMYISVHSNTRIISLNHINPVYPLIKSHNKCFTGVPSLSMFYPTQYMVIENIYVPHYAIFGLMIAHYTWSESHFKKQLFLEWDHRWS